MIKKKASAGGKPEREKVIESETGGGY